MAGPASNLAVDITDTVDRKIAALACHHSQGGDDPSIAERMQQWGQGSAATAGLPEGRLAELFWAIPTG
jgi:LmbE family N-acetylglucosaminyl deacetylase